MSEGNKFGLPFDPHAMPFHFNLYLSSDAEHDEFFVVEPEPFTGLARIMALHEGLALPRRVLADCGPDELLAKMNELHQERGIAQVQTVHAHDRNGVAIDPARLASLYKEAPADRERRHLEEEKRLLKYRTLSGRERPGTLN